MNFKDSTVKIYLYFKYDEKKSSLRKTRKESKNTNDEKKKKKIVIYESGLVIFWEVGLDPPLKV